MISENEVRDHLFRSGCYSLLHAYIQQSARVQAARCTEYALASWLCLRASLAPRLLHMAAAYPCGLHALGARAADLPCAPQCKQSQCNRVCDTADV